LDQQGRILPEGVTDSRGGSDKEAAPPPRRPRRDRPPGGGGVVATAGGRAGEVAADLMPKRTSTAWNRGRPGVLEGQHVIHFGEYGLKALEPAAITNRPIEAARIAMNRHIKARRKVWIYIFR